MNDDLLAGAGKDNGACQPGRSCADDRERLALELRRHWQYPFKLTLLASSCTSRSELNEITDGLRYDRCDINRIGMMGNGIRRHDSRCNFVELGVALFG